MSEQQSCPRPADRLVREQERFHITSVSRSRAWYLEKEGLFPRRIKLGSRSVAWRLSELNQWVKNKEKWNEKETV
ncbi:helix-turn-helix transcriptional regulator [Vibrio sp. 10N.222.55.A1]|uniref:helix-turn-helix transcriptional regulator n=1 Tax=Vibrio sp. 10N.222.55.A1 TaxID=3229646 RepID=UPI00354D9831